MDVTKSHAEVQRAYRLRLKQQNPELLRMREREQWRRKCLKKRSQHNNAESDSDTKSQNMALKHHDICNYNPSRHAVSASNTINEFNTAKYPIHDLLKWLEHVKAGDDVKYGFLKYTYGEKGVPPAYDDESTDASQGKRRRDMNEVQPCYVKNRKLMPNESSSESDVSYTYHENTERGVTPHRRKYGKKMSNKKDI